MPRTLKREITATDYLPFLRHADDHTIITTGRGAFQMLKIEGASFRTADTSGINALHDGLNHHIRNVADDNVMIYSHVIRSEDQDYPKGDLASGFGRWLDAAYKAQVQDKRLFRNDLYLTLYMQPRGLAGSRFAGGVIRRARKSQVEADQDLLDALDDKASLLARNLARYGARRLGLVKNAPRLALLGTDERVAADHHRSVSAIAARARADRGGNLYRPGDLWPRGPGNPPSGGLHLRRHVRHQ